MTSSDMPNSARAGLPVWPSMQSALVLLWQWFGVPNIPSLYNLHVGCNTRHIPHIYATRLPFDKLPSWNGFVSRGRGMMSPMLIKIFLADSNILMSLWLTILSLTKQSCPRLWANVKHIHAIICSEGIIDLDQQLFISEWIFFLAYPEMVYLYSPHST